MARSLLGACRLGLALLVCGGVASSAISADLDPSRGALERGQYGEALELWEARLPTLELREKASAQLQMASAYLSLGRVREAVSALQEANELATQDGDSALVSLVLASLSEAYLMSRQSTKATQLAREAVATARTTGEPLVLASTLNQLGNALMARGEYTSALRAYEQGIPLSQADLSLAIALSTNRVHAHLANRQPELGVPELRGALKQAHELPRSYAQAFDLISLGYLAQRLALQLPDRSSALTRDAYSAFSEALAIGDNLHNPRLQSLANGHLGELYSAAARDVEAERLLRRALFYASQSKAPELMARWQWQFGRMYQRRGAIDSAKSAYAQALAHLETIESALVYGYRGRPGSFRENVGQIYLELTQLLLEEADSASSEAEKIAAFRQARDVVESFKSVELKDYFRDECVIEQEERNRQLDLDTLIEPGSAVLYPIVLPDRLVMLLSLTGGRIEQVEVELNSELLRETVQNFRSQLETAGNPRRLLRHSSTLYDWLIRPLQALLSANQIDTLVIVPDEPLRLVPFAALYDGQEYLVSKFALAMTPGLKLTSIEPPSETGVKVLLSGVSEPVQGFGALPYVPQEIEAVAAQFESTRLLDRAFAKSKVESQLGQRPYSAVLFATHSRFEEDPQESFLLTYDDRLTLNDLEVLLKFGQFRDRRVDLLVLSACETAEGDERAALGLAGVAVKAGVNTVVASLWAVSDPSTAVLIPAFFEGLKDPKLSKAQALQRAQQNLLAFPEFRHPYHWSAFVLIGGWL